MATEKNKQKEPADWILKMRSVAHDIIHFNNKRDDMTHDQMMKKFYAIMKKHGIKQGEWSETGGRTCNNPEWTMCLHLMRDTHHLNTQLQDMFGHKMPKELMAYGTRPKVKMIKPKRTAPKWKQRS